MHVLNTFTDVLGIDPKRLNQINHCMLQISEQGTGVLVLLNNTSLAENKSENPPYILRQYGIGAQILKALGIKKIRLLSNSGTPKLIGIEGYGLEISDTIPIKNFKQKYPWIKLKNADILSLNDIKISSKKLNKFTL